MNSKERMSSWKELNDDEKPPWELWKVLLKKHNYNISNAWDAWIEIKQRKGL